ncbi:MAG: GyrI-like domain-containing protein [Candidatus Thorarchaeota archaeon]
MSKVKRHQWSSILDDFTNDIEYLLSSISNRSRLEMLSSLLQGPKEFDDLLHVVRLSKTALAHHLSKLLSAEMISNPKRGLYEITDDGVLFISAIVETYAKSVRRRNAESAKRAELILKAHSKKTDDIEESDVRIVKLNPHRVVSVRVISRSPENDAWQKMREWAEPLGLLNKPRKHPVYGFNNPNPEPGSSEYGYEFWMVVDREYELLEGMEYKEFKGGNFAVITCNLTEELESEFFKENGYLESWKKLDEWVRSSKYMMAKGPCLEHALSPDGSDGDFMLDLYHPIKEK